MASHQIKEMMEEAYSNSSAHVSYMDKYRKEQTEIVDKIESGVFDGVDNPKITLGKADLDVLRKKWNVPERNTVAVGKTDVPGLEGIIFEGGLPAVRKEAGLPDLDEIKPQGPIQAPRKSPQFTRHAEEGIINDFIEEVEKLNISPDKVEGTLYIHQSNPRGVCTACIQGISNPNVKPGIFMQLSKKYPNLIIQVTSEFKEGIKPSGKLNFILKGGILIG